MPKPAFKFELRGVKELDHALAQLPKAVGRSVLRQALTRAAAPVVAEAEQNAPVGATGTLQASITAKTTLTRSQKAQRVKAGAVEVFVGSVDPKSHLLEFGTSKMTAQPFLRPAWDANKHLVARILAREIWAALARSARRLAKQAETGKLSKASRRHFGA